MVNKIYRMICEKEENSNWERTLDAILLEYMEKGERENGLSELENYTIAQLSFMRFLDIKYFKDVGFKLIRSLQKQEE